MAKGGRSAPTAKGLLGKFPDLFRGTPPAELEFLAGTLTVERLPPGACPIVAGQPSDSLLLVVDGELEVLVDVEGRTASLGTVGPGSHVGEMGLLDPGPAPATVRAKTECTTWRLAQEGYLRVAAFDGRVARRIRAALVRSLAARLRATAEAMPGAAPPARRGGAGPLDLLGTLCGTGDE